VSEKSLSLNAPEIREGVASAQYFLRIEGGSSAERGCQREHQLENAGSGGKSKGQDGEGGLRAASPKTSGERVTHYAREEIAASLYVQDGRRRKTRVANAPADESKVREEGRRVLLK